MRNWSIAASRDKAFPITNPWIKTMTQFFDQIVIVHSVARADPKTPAVVVEFQRTEKLSTYQVQLDIRGQALQETAAAFLQLARSLGTTIEALATPPTAQ